MRFKVASRRASTGFILGYVLVAITVMSLAIAVAARMSASSGNNRRLSDARDEIVAQANVIRSKLLACTIQYPGGDNGLGYRRSFPAAPTSGLVADVTCPGNPGTNKSIWSVSDGVYAPRTMAGFEPWKYVHDATSARITLAMQSGNAINGAALNNSAIKFGNQASVSGNTLTIVIAN